MMDTSGPGCVRLRGERWVLAHLLQPVREQWIHIGAFFVVPTLAFWAVTGLVGFGWHPGWLGLWAATVGAAAAVGRWSIRKDAIISEASVLHP